MQATSAFSNNKDNNDNDNNNNNSNNNNKKKKYRTERRNSRFFVICSLRREPSPTRTFNGLGAIVCKSRATHRALITCNMSCYVPRDMKGQLSYINYIYIYISLAELNRICFSFIVLAEPLTYEGGEETGVSGENPWGRASENATH